MATAVLQHARILLVRAEAGEHWTHQSTDEVAELLAVADLIAVAVAVAVAAMSDATVEAEAEEEEEEG